jgi:Flavodoxin
MTALVLYESMFGNTRQIAEAIGDGLGEVTEVRVDLVSAVADPTADLVVVGAPTHAHSLPRASSRQDAAEWARDSEKHLALEPDAAAPGVREWLDALTHAPAAWAAFGTRADIPRIFAGDASAAIEKRMRRLGSPAVAPSECFLVTLDNELVDGELERAREWGRSLGRIVGLSARPRTAGEVSLGG